MSQPSGKPVYKSLLLVWLLITAALACRLPGIPRTSPPASPTLTLNASPTLPAADPPENEPAPGEPLATPPVLEQVEPVQQAALVPAALAGAPPNSELSHYTLSLDIDYNQLTFQGRLVLDHANSEDVSMDELYFRLFPNGGRSYGDGSLSVSQVLFQRSPLETSLTLNDSVLQVSLGQSLPPGERVELEMAFEGIVPRDFSGSGYGIYNFSQNVLALSGWFPLLAVYDEEGWNLDPISGIGDSVYADMALFTAGITLHQDLLLAATGVETSRQAQGDRVTYQYVSGPVRDFFLIVSPDYQVLTATTRDGVRVNSYYYQASLAAAQAGLDLAVKSLEVFSQQFGPYPYTELDLVEAPLRYAAGVEFPGIILAVDSAYSNPQGDGFTTLISHEVAHQWWYNLVGNDVFDDPWMDEGLTTYSSILFEEAAFGESAYEGTIRSYQMGYNSLVNAGRDHPVTEGLSYFENTPAAGTYGAVVYAKAALFFHTLRSEMGDEAFFDALQAYYEAYRYRIASPEDLLEIFQEHASQDLTGFYQEWLYSAHRP